MGVRWSKLFSGLTWRKQPVRLLMLGLDGAGKTTILLRLKLGEYLTTVPTIGFNVERVTYKSLTFVIWDCGGQDALRQLWRTFYKGTQALVFVIDSNDQQRLKDAKYELGQLLMEHELSNCPVLVLANKQDLPHALGGPAMADKLGLNKLGDRRTWRMQETCATTGEGLFDGLDWLATKVQPS